MTRTATSNAAAEPVPAGVHLASVLSEIDPLPAAVLPLRAATGLTLAAEVVSPHDLPLWNNSAMDGYAIRAAEVAEAAVEAPVVLRIVGEVAAGSAANPRIPDGSTVRIMTGAPMPDDADAVVPVEHTRGDIPGDAWSERTVSVLRAAGSGANVRRRGEDVARGDIIGRAGEPLGARRIAALAAAGVEEVRVRPRPRVSVLATGAELRGPGEPVLRGQIPESNSLLITALLAENGISAEEVHVSGDDDETLRERLRDLGSRMDAVITTGGVGPGRHDVVRMVLADEPGVRAVRVAVKPGQPQCVGSLTGGARIFALPGNPVSAAVSFELFVRPALLRMQGRNDVHRPRLLAIAEAPWRGSAGRLQVLPVRVRQAAAGLACVPAVNPRGVSHAVVGHGEADGYALVGPERGDISAGEAVDVILVGA